MRKINRVPGIVFIALIFYGCFHSTKPEPTESTNEETKSHVHSPLSANDSAALVNAIIEVKGDVVNPLRLNVDSLKKMKVVSLDEFNVVCQSGATVKTDKTSKGVLLRDILEKAVVKQLDHKDRNFIIVARASDDYKSAFSWGEIFNNPTGQNTYVLFEENGRPIKSLGEMVLICTNDIKTGPRHVNWLKSIEVARVD